MYAIKIILTDQDSKKSFYHSDSEDKPNFQIGGLTVTSSCQMSVSSGVGFWLSQHSPWVSFQLIVDHGVALS